MHDASRIRATASTLTPANVSDAVTGLELLVDEEPGLTVLADSAYGSGDTRFGLREAGHHQAIKPMPLRAAEFMEVYRQWRPMVERSIAWLVADSHRRVRYRGVERNRFGLSMRVSALNLRRLVNLGLGHDGSWAIAQ